MSTDVSIHEPSERTDSAPAPPAAYEISLIDFIIILAERKRTVFWITAIFAVLAIIVSFVLPKRYTASVVLLPPQQNSSLSATALSSQLGNMGGIAALAGGTLGLKNPNDMYVGMLKSRTVEDAMVQHFGLMQEYHDKYPSDARKDFEGHTTIDGSGKDNLIHISIEDRDPNRAAELANGYIDQYRKLSEHLAITEASQRRLFFEQQLEQSKDKLADAEEALKETEQKTGLIQLDSQARALIESAVQLRAQIAAKEVQIQSLRTYATAENSELVQAQHELEGLQAQLDKLGGSASLDSGLMVPKGQVPAAGLEYVRKLRDVKYNEAIFEILARQFELAKLDEAKQGSVVQVVDAAIPPDRRSFPKRAFIVIGATAVGLFFGVFLALVQASYEHRMRDFEAASKFRHLRDVLRLRRKAPFENASKV
jgi:tyrosine-protein kinase Etk/Wzc